MKVLIIGGTGFIGEEVAKQSLQAGHEVMLFNRGRRQSEGDSGNFCPSVKGDVDELKNFANSLRNYAPDVVVHTIA